VAGGRVGLIEVVEGVAVVVDGVMGVEVLLGALDD
jgi:hypothetical protein